MSRPKWEWDLAIRTALGLGLTIKEFWEVTPRDLELVSQAKDDQICHESKMTIWASWQVAAFVRSERLPDLETLLNSGGEVEDTPEELERRAREHAELVKELS